MNQLDEKLTAEAEKGLVELAKYFGVPLEVFREISISEYDAPTVNRIIQDALDFISPSANDSTQKPISPEDWVVI